MISQLEEAVVGAGEVIAETDLGGQMRDRHPGRRGAITEGVDDPFVDRDPLVQWEVGHGPFITRTFRGLEIARELGVDLENDSVREYVRWVSAAHRAIQRLAHRCWRPISKPARNLIWDEDELGPLVSSYIPDSREDELGPALRFQGLASDDVKQAWAALTSEVHKTPCYERALVAGQRLDGDLRGAARRQRERITSQLEGLDLGPVTMEEAHQRWKEIVERGYETAAEDLQEAALAIRGYNELVNIILWAVLGIAESGTGLIVLEGDLGAVRESGPMQRREVSLTLVAARMPHIATVQPFLVEAGVPADGLYISTSTLVQFTPTADPYIDVGGWRVASFEGVSSAGSNGYSLGPE